MTDIVIGVDPGNTTGVAVLTIEDGKITKEQLVHYDWNGLVNFLKLMRTPISGAPKNFHFVVEVFRLDPEKAKSFAGSEFLVCQVWGAVKYEAMSCGANYYEQERSLNNTAAKWSGRPIPKDHSKSHRVIAYNHAVYYATKNGLIPHRILSS